MEATAPKTNQPNCQSRYHDGLLHLRAGQPQQAACLLLQALNDRPEDAGVRRNLIRALLAAGRHAEVLDQAAIALALTPDDAEGHFARGTALNALRRPTAARAALTRAVVLDPGLASGWLNLGNACVDLDDLVEAERHYRTAIRLDPRSAEAQASLGHLHLGQGRVTEAIMACEAAVRLSPAMAEAHWNLASALLLSGDLVRGFRAYEWRKRHPAFRDDFSPMTGRCWDGGDPTGKVILVRSEQGFGDTIQFARFLLLIVQRGGTPVLTCDPRLVPLLAGMPGVVVLPCSAKVEGYDAWIDQMDLPRAFGTELATVPMADGYLHAEPARVAAWRSRVPDGPRIGIAWAGNPAQANDRRRSVPAAALGPLLAMPGVSFVNLQVGERGGDTSLHDLSAILVDYAETAALIANLDLVITVDSSVAHLAGALGCPVWVLLAHAADWRWLQHRDDSPWYTSARLFRQTAPGDWDGVKNGVIAALTERMAGVASQNRSSP
jgi:Flp pilus assembly protein TadD